MIKLLCKELRPTQYLKNLFIFSAPLFAGNIFKLSIIEETIFAFVSFSCMASVIYIINDIVDREKDRQHPVKCNRPIASGSLSVGVASIFSLILFILAIIISLYINIELTEILLFYMAINVLYSFRLKHVVIIDVFIIAIGFVLRALAGAIATGTLVTSWFMLCVFMLSLFLALAKRRGELEALRHEKSKQRKVLQNYSIKLIDSIMAIVSAIMLTSYSLFAQSSSEYTRGGQLSDMMLTVPVVMYGVFRYMFLVYIHGLGEQPESVLLKDKHILCTVIIYILVVLIIRDC